MRKAGHEVTVFEALHKFGGVLRYGIPPFRLPRTVLDREIQNLKDIGVKFEKNVIVGKSITLKQLKEDGRPGGWSKRRTIQLFGKKCFLIAITVIELTQGYM